MEAAPRAYSPKNAADLEQAVAVMADGIRMEVAATADSSQSLN
jgi:hypothetical protein